MQPNKEKKRDDNLLLGGEQEIWRGVPLYRKFSAFYLRAKRLHINWASILNEENRKINSEH